MKTDLEKRLDRGLARVQGEISAYFISHLVVSTESNDCCLCVCRTGRKCCGFTKTELVRAQFAVADAVNVHNALCQAERKQPLNK